MGNIAIAVLAKENIVRSNKVLGSGGGDIVDHGIGKLVS